jgi:hypothetical protein
MQRSRCTGETEFFCYRDKITKVTEFHGRTYSALFPVDRPPVGGWRSGWRLKKIHVELEAQCADGVINREDCGRQASSPARPDG